MTELFRIVARGDADHNVPVCNGGLFLTEVASRRGNADTSIASAARQAAGEAA